MHYPGEGGVRGIYGGTRSDRCWLCGRRQSILPYWVHSDDSVLTSPGSSPGTANMDRRGTNPKVVRGLATRPRILWGWRCGARPTSQPLVKTCKRRALPRTSGDNEQILKVSMAAARLSLWPFRAISTAMAVLARSRRFRFSSQRLVTCWRAATPLVLERQKRPDACPDCGAA
jgi:hypothetical protein